MEFRSAADMVVRAATALPYRPFREPRGADVREVARRVCAGGRAVLARQTADAELADLYRERELAVASSGSGYH